jgi:hypothetical protein
MKIKVKTEKKDTPVKKVKVVITSSEGGRKRVRVVRGAESGKFSERKKGSDYGSKKTKAT